MAIYTRKSTGEIVPLKIPAIKGEQGIQGDKGDTGPKGEPGITPNITIGDVTTVGSSEEATVTKKGTAENPILDFAIPRGDSGVYVGSKDSAPESAKIIVDKSSDGLYLNQVVTVPVVDSILNLTANKAQNTVMENNTTIVLPNVKGYTEIHLFFYAESDLTLIFPNIKWQSQPEVKANKKHEFIFTHETEWLGGCICYE